MAAPPRLRHPRALGACALGLTLLAAPLAAQAGPPPPPAPLPPIAALPPAEPALAPLRLVVNIPAGRLDVFGPDSSRLRSYPVSVGMARYQTPRGSYRIARAIWNPWWVPPPESEWAKGAKAVPPGVNNPMGRVKLHMEEMYYIHGTVARNEKLLGRPASHGCIRMANRDVVALAKLLHEEAAPETLAQLPAMDKIPPRTREFRYSRPVQLEVVYERVEVRDSLVVIHPDVYQRAKEPLREQLGRALARAGHDPARLKVADAAGLLGRAARGLRASAPLDALLRPATDTTPQPLGAR